MTSAQHQSIVTTELTSIPKSKMSFEKLEQATPVHKEEGQAGLPEVSISAADIRTDQLPPCPTEDIEGTVVAVGESMNGKRVEVAGADATPDSTPYLTTQASQLKIH
jgi:hypothetical protein